MRFVRSALLLCALLTPFTAQAALDGLLGGARDLATSSMPALLGDRLGVSSKQAEGGIGAMLMLARERLVAGDFDRLAGMIPGASSYLQTAKSMLAPGTSVESVDGLESSLGGLGYSEDAVTSFAPTVTDLVSNMGGERAGALLSQVFAAP